MKSEEFDYAFSSECGDWIPRDLLLNIFQHLDLRSLLLIQRVSKKW